MRKVYRRRRVHWRGLLTATIGILVAVGLSADLLSSILSHMRSVLRGEWIESTEWVGLQLTVIGFVLSILKMFLSPWLQSSDRHWNFAETKAVKARFVGKHRGKFRVVAACGVATILGLPMLIAGVADLVTTGGAGKHTVPAMFMGGLLIAFAIMSIDARRHQKPTVIIDRNGIDTGRGNLPIPWASIAEIRVRSGFFQKSYPVYDDIHLVLRDESAAYPEHALRISPWRDLSIPPEAVLQAIDTFRPPAVLIHDPRRITDDGQE